MSTNDIVLGCSIHCLFPFLMILCRKHAIFAANNLQVKIHVFVA